MTRTLALLCLLLATVPARAQTPDRIALAVRGEPLAHALDRFAEHARLDLAYDPALTDGKRAYCVAERLSREQALSCLLRGSGLDFLRLSNGLYVLRPAARVEAEPGTIVGVVRDATSSLGLPEASVLIAARETRGVASNADGQFAFADLVPGRYAVLVSYVGYQSVLDTVEVLAGGHVRHEVHLERINYTVSPLVIDGLNVSAVAPYADLIDTRATLAASELNTLVGVSVNHATADVHIQGGGAGEHQGTLDGAPIFTAPTLTGQIGAFSPLAVGRMRVQKAGFGVQASSNTVGIIEVDHDLSTQPGHRIDAQADALSGALRHRYSSARGSSAALRSIVSGRVGAWSLYRQAGALSVLQQQNVPDALVQTAFEAPPAGRMHGQDTLAAYLVDPTDVRLRDPELGFADLNAAVRWAPGPLRHLHVSGYLGYRTLETDGIFDDPRRDEYSWTSGMVQARYTTFLSSRTFASLQLRSSFYRQSHRFTSRERADSAAVLARGMSAADAAIVRPNDDGNTIAEWAAEARLDHAIGRGAHLEAGFVPTLTAHRFALSTINLSPTQNALINHYRGVRLGSFANLSLPLARAIGAEVGVRATYIPETDIVYAEPRVALRLDARRSPIGPVSARVSTGLYRQFVSQYRVSSRSVTTLASSSTAWIHLHPDRPPTAAVHAAGEVGWQPLPGWRVSAEAFHKHLHALYAVNHAATPLPDETPQEVFLERTRGFSSGATVGVERTTERLHMGARYERSNTEREFSGFDDHMTPVPWNEPHRFSARANVTLGSRAVLAARWTSVWQRAWSYRQAYYDFISAQRDQQALRGVGVGSAVRQEAVARHVLLHRLEDPQTNRLGTFHQLDVSAAYTLPVGATRLQLRLDLLNALGRRNEVERQFVGDAAYYEQTGLFKASTRYSLPFTTVWSVRWTL
jgi:hypothetical protein